MPDIFYQFPDNARAMRISWEQYHFPGFCASKIISNVSITPKRPLGARTTLKEVIKVQTMEDVRKHITTILAENDHTSLVFTGPDDCDSTKLFEMLLDNFQSKVWSDRVERDIDVTFSKVEYPEFLNINSFNKVKIRMFLGKINGSEDAED